MCNTEGCQDVTYGVLCRYGGHVIAKLPFAPFSLLAKVSQRGIESPAANDCSVVSTYWPLWWAHTPRYAQGSPPL